MANNIEIFVGTYEEFLLSYKIIKRNDETFSMERFITLRGHNDSILCMDTFGRYLATGGADDRINIIDLKLNKAIQTINRHQSSVNAVLFTNDGSHLLSGSEDGQLIATKIGSWITENVWNKPHSGKAVVKICLHESGKFAFTLGKDGTLRSWDMIKGTTIHTTNVKELSDAKILLDNIQLCPNGSTFVMSGLKTVKVISCIAGKLYDDLQFKHTVTSMCWIDNENLLIGMENGTIEWLNVTEWTYVNLPDIHKRRVKGMHCINGFLGTICSTGDLSLWQTMISKKTLSIICTVNISCRPICVKLINTTENRCKEEVKDLIVLEDVVTNSLEKSKPISIVGKVTVEEGDSDNDQPHKFTTEKLANYLEVDPYETNDTTATSKKRKKNKMNKKITPECSDSTKLTTATRNQFIDVNDVKLSSLEKRMIKTISTKTPIVVHSRNSDDDFDIEPTLKKKRNSQFTGHFRKTEKDEINVTQITRKKNTAPSKSNPKKFSAERAKNAHTLRSETEGKKKTISSKSEKIYRTPKQPVILETENIKSKNKKNKEGKEIATTPRNRRYVKESNLSQTSTSSMLTRKKKNFVSHLNL